jgi:hypothetical protein
MDRTDFGRFLMVAVLAAAVTCLVPGCSPRNDAGGPSQSRSEPAPRSPLEIECERELLYLDSLIESRRRDRDFPPAALAEAIELRRSAAELILDEELELALELLDEAIALLRESK